MGDLGQVLAIVLTAAAIISSLRWVAGDARKRKQGFAVVVLCLLTWPFGIVAWFLLRPSVSSAE